MCLFSSIIVGVLPRFQSLLPFTSWRGMREEGFQPTPEARCIRFRKNHLGVERAVGGSAGTSKCDELDEEANGRRIVKVQRGDKKMPDPNP